MTLKKSHPPRWTKAKTLAERFTSGDLSFESLVATIDQAIAYGRARERAAVLRRIERGYANGVFADDLTSGEVLDGVRDLVRDGRAV